MFTLDSDGVYRAAAFQELNGLRHGFGTRLSSEWPGGTEVATVRQVHSDRIVTAEGPGVYGEADALIANRSGFLLAIRTADCVPALIVDPATHSVAAVHAGWRGTAASIVPKTLRAMQEHFGTRPEDVLVAIGPAIGQCCFEVGPEVSPAFQEWFPERVDLTGRTKVDLVETNLRQAVGMGVRAANISVLGACTRCGSEKFHSWRRDAQQAGRMVSGVGWDD